MERCMKLISKRERLITLLLGIVIVGIIVAQILNNAQVI